MCRRAVLAELRLRGARAFGTVVAAAGVGSLIGIVSAGQVGGFRRRGLIEFSLTGVLGFIVAGIAFVPNLAGRGCYRDRRNGELPRGHYDLVAPWNARSRG